MKAIQGNKVSEEWISEYEKKVHDKGWPTSKWIEFVRYFMKQGFDVWVYCSRKTLSKYVTLVKGRKTFKVRFSNHMPIKHLEMRGSCDFFVVVTNLGCWTTEQATEAACAFFNVN